MAKQVNIIKFSVDKINLDTAESILKQCTDSALELSKICSKREGAQGVFYDEELFESLKKRYRIKLEGIMGNDLSQDAEDTLAICKSCFMNVV